MERWIIFGILSLPVIIFSWRTLFHIRSHGFYRFFSWECILWLLVSNYRYWFVHPFGIAQLFSWMFLICSGYVIVAGVIMMKRKGGTGGQRDDNTLYAFEKTTELIDTGIFNYIRHPLYSSLLFLGWGIYLKNPDLPLLPFALANTIFLFITAVLDEKECMTTFGPAYREYMKRSKRFIPYIL
jgi:protein-S-isoprenylcysteine O-methyltransferase Ste14